MVAKMLTNKRHLVMTTMERARIITMEMARIHFISGVDIALI